MNLIELSNQLKDVPDQFLMKEVQAPSGAYPAYMVITELTRRKRMRESAAKEMPQTTVAEDLVGEQERARAMAQVQNQMAQDQPMISPSGSLNAPAAGGLGALPEAQGSLAAQDAMGTTPPEMMMPTQNMAGGGMVSFKEGGNVPRYNGEFGSMVGGLYGMSEEDLAADQARIEESARQKKMQEDIQRYRFLEKSAPDVAKKFLDENPALAASLTPKVAPSVAIAAPSAGVPSAAPAAAPAGIPGAAQISIPPVSSPQLTKLKSLADAPITLPTEEALAARAASGETEFAGKVPYRFGFLEDQLKSEAAKLQGREQSNINEALIQAGLGIMGSKSPRFLQAASEGGLSALRAYKEGQRDIRESERALMQSRIKAAEAQSLYDRDKFAAGDKKRAQSMEYAKAAADLQNTQSANIARVIQGEATLAREAREAAESPSKIAYTQALARQADAQASMKVAPTTADILAAKAQVKGMFPGLSPAAFEQKVSELLAAQGKVYTPQGLTGAPGTGAKFLGFEK